MMFILLLLLVALFVVPDALAASKDKPHGHQGVLKPYDGTPLPLKITSSQSSKLDKGDSVQYNERDGKSGMGVVIQDVNASIPITMDRIRDLTNYKNMVPHVKKVEIYHNEKFINGTSKTGAKFDLGLMGIRVSYFLLLTHEPKHNTLTWTLDYSKNSDFDDNCGHWQLQPHPTKKGWTRVLYSTKIKLFNWVPEFIVKFLTSKALTESTDWVKRESEKRQSEVSAAEAEASAAGSLKMPSWFDLKGGAAAFRNQLDTRIQSVENELRTQRQRFHSYVKMPRFKAGGFGQ
mmetsp:Transcript_31820/g.53690  ORF Transcript_31820/g.53690 Transcript_31820/m.53690 type:complete len:290 (-) Transcript_31820:1361-2230(-)|eukprot:CAMPEP_0174966096 /NCGR_PEP_ID=MMETSP0004_2-20121128/6797_1 /TAXON_ID=420556 /ORGANISM="Ochromonas sp., Strain CCMP1393" /LENGTH=289 /DNA_ID=CAMNT_0016214997 /DNA_START=42 /DNA_END=911 /DNA_ORIENTATION=-